VGLPLGYQARKCHGQDCTAWLAADAEAMLALLYVAPQAGKVLKWWRLDLQVK
jgi:hypothetical protein